VTGSLGVVMGIAFLSILIVRFIPQTGPLVLVIWLWSAVLNLFVSQIMSNVTLDLRGTALIADDFG